MGAGGGGPRFTHLEGGKIPESLRQVPAMGAPASTVQGATAACCSVLGMDHEVSWPSSPAGQCHRGLRPEIAPSRPDLEKVPDIHPGHDSTPSYAPCPVSSLGSPLWGSPSPERPFQGARLSLLVRADPGEDLAPSWGSCWAPTQDTPTLGLFLMWWGNPSESSSCVSRGYAALLLSHLLLCLIGSCFLGAPWAQLQLIGHLLPARARVSVLRALPTVPDKCPPSVLVRIHTESPHCVFPPSVLYTISPHGEITPLTVFPPPGGGVR